MTTELFTLCDGAFNTNGRLTIVNTFDNVAAKSFPWKMPLGLALKLGVPSQEKGEHTLAISFINSVGGEILHSIKLNFNIPIDEQDGHIALATNIQGIIFNSSGKHCVVVSVDDKEINRLSFDVIAQ